MRPRYLREKETSLEITPANLEKKREKKEREIILA